MIDKNKAKARILSALRDYVDLGLPIIPICGHDHVGYSERHIATCNQAGKIPLIKGWQTHGSTTVQQVQAWVKEFKNINIGLPLGNASGYVGIDVDGDLGEELLMEMSGGDLPETWEYITGAGRRLLYQIPVGLQTKKFVNTGQGEHQECSILAEGQQTVLPPSIHYTGRVYEWIETRAPEDLDCALAPKWLLDLIRADSTVGLGTMDLTKTGVPHPNSTEGIIINPIIVSDNVLPSEFSEYHELALDTIPPDTTYAGKGAKEQEREEEDKGITEDELMEKISSGNRDNQMTRIIGSFCARFRSLGKEYITILAKNHNLMFCSPPLDDMAIEAKVNHFWEMEQMKSAQFKNGSISDDKKQFAPGIVAQTAIELLQKEGYCLKVDPAQSIVWMTKKTQGPWVPMDARSGQFYIHLREALSNPECGGDAKWTTIRHYRDAANALVIELRAAGRLWDIDTMDKDTQTIGAYQFIPLAGGKLLNWRTGELLPWDPETNLTYVLPVEYDPDAEATSWDARLKEWLPDEGSRLIIQEFIGYSLIPYMGFEKALVIQGEGANGKSIFLEAIQGLLGYKVVDSINMRNLFSRFGQADLVGKILNIVNEAGSEYLRGGHADDFKNLVSGGRVKADVKNQAMLTFNNTAKFIFASNHDIKTGDKSEGWLRRMLMVPFEQDFRNSTVPKFEIMQELRLEYSGIFNWALEGLRRLMKTRTFSSSEAADRKKQDYIGDNDVTADFFMHCLETFTLDAYTSNGKLIRSGTPSSLINVLFSEWLNFRESSVQKKVEHITKYLEKKHGLHKARTTHTLHVDKVMTECWIGLRLNIRNSSFLEALINEPILRFPELKTYATERLREIDASNGYDGPNGGGSGSSSVAVMDFPTTQAK